MFSYTLVGCFWIEFELTVDAVIFAKPLSLETTSRSYFNLYIKFFIDICVVTALIKSSCVKNYKNFYLHVFAQFIVVLVISRFEGYNTSTVVWCCCDGDKYVAVVFMAVVLIEYGVVMLAWRKRDLLSCISVPLSTCLKTSLAHMMGRRVPIAVIGCGLSVRSTPGGLLVLTFWPFK